MEKIVAINGDLISQNQIVDKTFILNNPIYTFVVGLMSEEDINSFLSNLYFQKFPRFEVLIVGDIPEDYKNMPNITAINSDAKEIILENSKGQYVVFINEKVVYNQNTLTDIYKKLQEPSDGVKIAIVNLKCLKDDESIDELLLYTSDFLEFHEIDNSILINKIFPIEYLKKSGVNINSSETVRIRDINIFTDKSDMSILAALSKGKIKRSYKKLIKKSKHIY